MTRRYEGVTTNLTYAQERVLDYLTRNGTWSSIGELATSLDVHKNSVRAAINVLLSRKLIEREQLRTGERGRPSWLYRVFKTPTSHLRSAMTALEGASKEERELLEDVFHGKHLNALADSEDFNEALVRFLNAEKMDAHIVGNHVEISSCPFRDINPGRASYACRLHRIVIENAVGSGGQVRLRPLCAENVCHVSVVPTN